MPASIQNASMQEIHPYKHMSLAKLHEAARDAAYLRCKIHNKVRISQGPYAVKAGRRPGSTSALGQTTSPAQRPASMVWRYLLRCAGDVARATNLKYAQAPAASETAAGGSIPGMAAAVCTLCTFASHFAVRPFCASRTSALYCQFVDRHEIEGVLRWQKRDRARLSS